MKKYTIPCSRQRQIRHSRKSLAGIQVVVALKQNGFPTESFGNDDVNDTKQSLLATETFGDDVHEGN